MITGVILVTKPDPIMELLGSEFQNSSGRENLPIGKGYAAMAAVKFGSERPASVSVI